MSPTINLFAMPPEILSNLEEEDDNQQDNMTTMTVLKALYGQATYYTWHKSKSRHVTDSISLTKLILKCNFQHQFFLQLMNAITTEAT